MKTFTTSLILALAALGLAAPAAVPALQKRAAGTITLFTEKNYGGQSVDINFNVNEPTCVAPTLPANIDGQASSVRLSATGSGSGFNCRLASNQNCVIDDTNEATWFFNVDIPDLSADDYTLDNQARSVLCSPV